MRLFLAVICITLLAACATPVAAQKFPPPPKPDTGRTRDGTPVFNLPRVAPRAEEFKFAKDSAATSADTAAILRAAPADSGLWYYVVHQIVGDTAWVQSWRRIQPGDTTFTDYNGQRVAMVSRVTKGYRIVARRHGVWTLVPLPPPR